MGHYRIVASRLAKYPGAFDPNSPYGKRMVLLSNRIFGEVTRKTDKKSMRIVELMSAEPVEQKEEKGPEYFPNLPMFHYLSKMLRLHGLFHHEHYVWDQVQDEIRMQRGKQVRYVIGQGKRAQLRAAKIKSS